MKGVSDIEDRAAEEKMYGAGKTAFEESIYGLQAKYLENATCVKCKT